MKYDVTLHGDIFLLRPWKVEDATWYVESRDEEVFKWTKEKKSLTIAQAEEAIRSLDDNPDAIGFAIVDNKNLELVGNIALAFREKNRKIAEVMYWLAPSGRGRGIATNSVKLLCQWAFGFLRLELITLKTHAGNVRSQSVAKRAGFQARENALEDKSNTNILWFDLKNSR
jgi:RimJ/RimL family protein N-acetyltransferase